MVNESQVEQRCDFKYWAFISYSHADKNWADWLHRALETYRIPKRLVGAESRDGKVPSRAFPVFRDRDELPVSADLGGNLREALYSSRYLIAICSPRSAHSLWVNEEIKTFKRLGREDRVLALIVDGEPNASDGKPGFNVNDECFPEAIRFRVNAEGGVVSTRTEPIAADARPGMDGRANAKLKLLAGILGVNFDELKQRDRIRRRRRTVATIFAVILLTASSLGIWEFQARRGRERLERQRRQQIAEQAEEQGRLAMLTGDIPLAVASFERALAAAPVDCPATKLMLGVAKRQSDGTATVLERGEERVFEMHMDSTGANLLTIGNGQRVATVWDLRTNRVIREFGGHKCAFGGSFGPQFNFRGDKLLWADSDRWVVHDVIAGTEVWLPGGSFSRFCFLGNQAYVLGCREPKNGNNDLLCFDVFDGITGCALKHFDFGCGKIGGLQADAMGHTACCGWFSPAPTPAGVSFWQGEPRLKWFEIKTGKVIADLPRHDSASPELSPDGQRLLYLRPDGVFEVRSRECVLWTFPTANAIMPEAHWSQGGRYVISNIMGETSVRDATTGKLLWKDIFSYSSTDRSDSYLAYADSQGRVRVRELGSGTILAEFTDRIGWPDLSENPEDRLVQFTPDAQKLLLAGSGKKVKIWDWRRSRADRSVLGNPMDSSKPTSVLFSPDGTLLGVRKDDASAIVYELSTGRQRVTINAREPDGGVQTMAFSPDGKKLLTGSEVPSDLYSAILWDTTSGKQIVRLDDGGKTVSANGRIATRSPLLEQRISVGWGSQRMITVNFNLGLGCLWNTAAQPAKLLEFPTGSGPADWRAARNGSIHVSVSRDESRFMVADFTGTVRVFTLAGAKLLSTLRHPFQNFTCAELSADGSTLLTRDSDSHLLVWDLAQSKPLRTINPGPVEVNEAHISADARFALAACSDNCVRLWDVRTGVLRTTFREQKPPGGGGIETLGAPVDMHATEYASGFLATRMDPRGFWIAGANEDGYVCVWEIATGRQLFRWKLDSPSHDIHLAVAPDGGHLGAFGFDGAVRVFDLTPPKHP